MTIYWQGSNFVASVAENDVGPRVVGTITANDYWDRIVSYQLSGPGSEYFSIDQQSGRLSVIPPSRGFDYESQNSYSIVVKAYGSDEFDNAETATHGYVLKINNLNDNDAAFVNTPLKSRRIAEAVARPGYAIASFVAADGDGQAISYSLSRSAGAVGDFFTIDSNGVLAVRSAINSNGFSPSDRIFSLTIFAHSLANGLITAGKISTTFVISLANQNDTPPAWAGVQPSGVAMTETNNLQFAIANFLATDPDNLGGNDFQVEYSLSGDDSGYFTLVENTAAPRGRTLKLASALNYESATHRPYYSVVVVASQEFNNGQQQISQLFVLTLQNADESPTVWTQNSAGVNIDEKTALSQSGAVAGAVLTTFAAVDGDGQTIQYNLLGGDANRFTLDRATGVLKLTGDMDYESEPNRHGRYSVLVQAAGNPAEVVGPNAAFNITQLFILSLNNLDDGEMTLTHYAGYYTQDPLGWIGRTRQYSPPYPVYQTGSMVHSISESNSISLLQVATFVANDADADVTISYSLYNVSESNHDTNYFSINQNGGLYWSGSSLDYENGHGPVYSVLVRALSSDGDALTAQFVLTILNVDEAVQWAGPAPTAITLIENDKVKQSIAQFSAIDLDGTAVKYDLLTTPAAPDANYFSIDSHGKLTFKYSLDYDTPHSPYYTVAVRAYSGERNGLTPDSVNFTTQNFVLRIRDKTTIDGDDNEYRIYDNLNNGANDHDYIHFTNLHYNNADGESVAINGLTALQTSFIDNNWYFVLDDTRIPNNHYGHIVFDGDGDHNLTTGGDQYITLYGGDGGADDGTNQFRAPDSWERNHVLTFDEFLNLIGGSNHLTFG